MWLVHNRASLIFNRQIWEWLFLFYLTLHQKAHYLKCQTTPLNHTQPDEQLCSCSAVWCTVVQFLTQTSSPALTPLQVLPPGRIVILMFRLLQRGSYLPSSQVLFHFLTLSRGKKEKKNWYSGTALQFHNMDYPRRKAGNLREPGTKRQPLLSSFAIHTQNIQHCTIYRHVVSETV